MTQTATMRSNAVALLPHDDDPDDPGILPLRLAGVVLPMRHRTTKKTGNDQWCVQGIRADGGRYYSRAGVNIPALADVLPAVVQIGEFPDEVSLHLSQPGKTEVNGHMVELPITQKRTGRCVVTIDGQPYQVSVTLRDCQDGTWNLTAQTNRVQDGGIAFGGPRTTAISKL